MAIQEQPSVETIEKPSSIYFPVSAEHKRAVGSYLCYILGKSLKRDPNTPNVLLTEFSFNNSTNTGFVTKGTQIYLYEKVFEDEENEESPRTKHFGTIRCLGSSRGIDSQLRARSRTMPLLSKVDYTLCWYKFERGEGFDNQHLPNFDSLEIRVEWADTVDSQELTEFVYDGTPIERCTPLHKQIDASKPKLKSKKKSKKKSAKKKTTKKKPKTNKGIGENSNFGVKMSPELGKEIATELEIEDDAAEESIAAVETSIGLDRPYIDRTRQTETAKSLPAHPKARGIPVLDSDIDNILSRYRERN